MMRPRFGVVDCTRHFGLPVTTACLILSVLAAIANCYTLYFLPDVAADILMSTAGVIGLVGVVATIAKLRIMIILYLVFETLIRIPVAVVIGYMVFTLINWDNCSRVGHYELCFSYSAYQSMLFSLELGTIWSALIVGCIASILSGMSLGGFRKLRLFAAGVHRVQRGGPHHHHHEHVVVAQPCYPAQPTVYTTGVPHTGQQPTYMMQQPQQPQPPMYPQVNQQQAYPQPAAYPQPTNYNPPAYNPDHQ